MDNVGTGNTESLNYAKAVLGEQGGSYLTNIIDISAGAKGSIAIDEKGNVYTWGNGTVGELGNGTFTSRLLPCKAAIDKVIKVSIGVGHAGALTMQGNIATWGYNNVGQLGINSTLNTAYPRKASIQATDISLGGYHTVIKKTDENIYVTRIWCKWCNAEQEEQEI